MTMDQIAVNNAIGLLEECIVNLRNGTIQVWAVSEKNLIEQTIEDLRELEEELYVE